MAGSRQATVADAPTLNYLQAKNTIGKPWPLTSEFHPALSSLSTGKWMVLVVRPDCEHCRALVQTHFADARSHRRNERTALFIANPNQWQFELDRISFIPNSRAFIKWKDSDPFVASPAVFLLEDGKVVDASDGDESTKMVDRLKPEFTHP